MRERAEAQGRSAPHSRHDGDKARGVSRDCGCAQAAGGRGAQATGAGVRLAPAWRKGLHLMDVTFK